MTDLLFITVRTYSSVNNMGKELGAYVENMYDQALVPTDAFPAVTADIKAKMKELEAKYPRSKPFELETISFTDKYGHTHENIYVTPQNRYNDNHVFCLDTASVRVLLHKLYMKGGEV